MTEHLLPLAERVTAPVTLALPQHKDIASWRPASPADLDAVWQMQQQSDSVDHPDWTTPREELEEHYAASHVDLARDSILAFDVDGRIAAHGYVLLRPGQETRVQSYLIGTVRPDQRGRGIGRLLLDWQLGRSRQQLAGSDKALPGWSMIYAEQGNGQAISLAERAGFEIQRYFTAMNRVVADPIPELGTPDGIRIVHCTPDLFDATLVARNDAFRDHWGSQPRLPEQWAAFTGGSQFRSDLSWAAIAGDGDEQQVVAFALSTLNEDDWPLQGYTSGYVALIGVVRGWRGRRLAPALLARLLHSYRAAGLERAVLDVDTASPTGANGLYERMGFVATTQEVALVLEH